VPILASSNFVVDLPTLCAVTVFVTATGGLLLLFAWVQNRNEPALAFWGVGYLIGATGAALLALGESIPDAWSVCGANALICCAYGIMWGGARSFEGRRVSILAVIAGAAIWITAYRLRTLDSMQPRVVLASAIFSIYVLLAAREVWHARDRELISRWPTLALLVMHAGFLLARIAAAGALALAAADRELHQMAFSVMAFEALFATFCLAFLRMGMAKERAELAQRNAALTDSLTGIANRRAFFDFGALLLDRTIADRRPAALLLFDLDRFKEVNDTAGHQAGDRVLEVFSGLVNSAMRRGDLFARLGGEEFACLLLDAPMAQALQLAERVRREFAELRFPDLPSRTTVSVGVAMAGEAGRNLSALLATADRALYRAKAEGRNRVAPAPLVLIDAGGGEAMRHVTDIGRAIPAPLRG
jgi:diguanylate cyclase (GGDEF)-like protein